MKTPEWLKPGIYGGIIGGIAVAVIGFGWAGWSTAGGANRLAQTVATEQTVAALVPVCLAMSAADPERVSKIATIQQATTSRRRDALIATGWATMPGSDAPNRDLATACVAALELPAA